MSDGVLAPLYARGDPLPDGAWLRAMLAVEAALARANAAAGLIPPAAADAIAAACRADAVDPDRLAAATAASATPVVGLVAALRAAVPADVAPHVHHGATSQDVVDTAVMLLARDARAATLTDARASVTAAARLARAHRDTPMAGRTLLQQALPTTFGLRAAGWATGIDAAATQLAALPLPVQMGGPVGARDPQVAGLVAAALGLEEPVLPYHADRVAPASLAAALGVLAGALAKVARDVTLLAQTEVGEAREGGEGRGGSSSMPHKRNPAGAVAVLACAARTPGLVATMLAVMPQEHERAAGGWQAEWGTLAELLTLTRSAAAWGRELLERLEIDPARMRANLGAGPVPPASAGALVDRALAALSAR
jgi:3-carboxy-cis,cis-muconate cycloisomerase